MGWEIAALLSSFAAAAMAFLGERNKGDTLQMLFIYRGVSLLILIPVIGFITYLPTSPLFYIYVGVGALMFAYTDIIFLIRSKFMAHQFQPDFCA